MIQKKKMTILKSIIMIVLTILGSTTLHPLIVLNKGNEAFIEPDSTQSAVASVSIESLIINSAGYFLEGNCEFLFFLKKVETTVDPSNVNYDDLQSIINRSIEQMTKSRDTYYSLVDKANSTPYNSTVINRLIQFDYRSFKTQRGISGNPIDTLWDLLEEGDVRGVFTKLRDDTVKILDELQVIKASVDVNQFPSLSKLWRLNQLFSETMLFGQYAAEIFYEVSE